MLILSVIIIIIGWAGSVIDALNSKSHYWFRIIFNPIQLFYYHMENDESKKRWLNIFVFGIILLVISLAVAMVSQPK